MATSSVYTPRVRLHAAYVCDCVCVVCVCVYTCVCNSNMYDMCVHLVHVCACVFVVCMYAHTCVCEHVYVYTLYSLIQCSCYIGHDVICASSMQDRCSGYIACICVF